MTADIDVVFLDTGYYFAETIATHETVVISLAVNVVTATADLSVAEQNAAYAKDLFARDPYLCCSLRKVKLLEDQFVNYDAWATGLRRDEPHHRADVPAIGWDPTKCKVKISPLARWSAPDVEHHIQEFDVPVNPLQHDGHLSIGCWPCTRRVAPGEDPRDGRWAGTATTECGIHQ